MSLIIRERKTKTKMNVTSNLLECMLSKTQENINSDEDVGKRNPFALLVGMSTGADTLETSMDASQKIKNNCHMI